MNELLVGLTYPEALAALQTVASKIADAQEQSLPDMEKALKQEAARQRVRLPASATDAPRNVRRSGPFAIEILRALLASENEFLVAAAQSGILEFKGTGQTQSFVAATIAVGAVVFAIGLLSKIEYNEDGLKIHKGFPELEKIPALVKTFFSGNAD